MQSDVWAPITRRLRESHPNCGIRSTPNQGLDIYKSMSAGVGVSTMDSGGGNHQCHRALRFKAIGGPPTRNSPLGFRSPLQGKALKGSHAAGCNYVKKMRGLTAYWKRGST